MRCVYCGFAESKVVDSRPVDEGTSTRRRRECLSCSRRFTTYEKAEQTPMMVIKKDGRREAFDVEKVKKGMLKACEKRNVSMAEIDNLAIQVERAVTNLASSEVDSVQVGEIVMNELRNLDKVAYVRFASVYREFNDVSTFMDEIKRLLPENGEG